MPSLAVEVLSRWRAVERYRTALPDDAPERPRAVAMVEELRLLHADLTARADRSRERIERANAMIVRADALLRRTEDRIASTVPAYPHACEGAGPHLGAVTYRLPEGRHLCGGCLQIEYGGGDVESQLSSK